MKQGISMEFSEASMSAALSLFDKLLEVSGLKYYDTMTHGMEAGPA
jgi:hypothetical protein